MAGKGDTPRPVAGEKFRANYDTIFSKGRPYPDWICRPCGEAHGRGMPEGHVSTWHMDTCGICGRQAEVTEPRDFRHLKAWPL
jgi:hypothetical protein